MADPIIPDIIRAQIIFHGHSALPEDRFVNSFAFHGVQGFGTDIQEEHDEAVRLLTNFYTVNNGAGATIAQYMTGYASVELRTYNLSSGPPREPIITDPIAGWPLAGAGAMPYEVSLVCSFESAQPGPRGRGRIYVGPLRTTALDEVATHVPRPEILFQGAVREAAVAMAADNTILQWGVVSQVNGAFYPVTGGWVDNAWDTQRSRGLAPTARTTWGSAT